MSIRQDPIRPEIAALEQSGIGKVASRGRGDPDVIPLWFGESDLTTPSFIGEAAKRALDAGRTFYSHVRGEPRLREALIAYNERLYGTRLHPDRVSAPGSTMLTVTLAGQCLLEAGDEIVLISPYWPNIRQVATILGAVPIEVRLREGPGRWWLDMDEVAASITSRTRAVYVNSPSNPTGWVMTATEQADLLALCRRHGLGLIADEVYHRNVFDGPGPAPSFLRIADEQEPVFVLNGFSKAWAMTGWRLGWMITPRRLAPAIQVLAEVSNTGAPAFLHDAAIAALEEGEEFVAMFNARIRENRDVVMRTLGRHPRAELLAPEGAFYAFARIDGIEDSLAFAYRVLEEVKIGIAAGYSFGRGNERHVRLCFALAPERMAVALKRLTSVLDRL